MQPILMLVHRIPFPPNKGDKIRAYHLLKYLSQRVPVYLGAFIDDPTDWCYVNELKSICENVFVLPLNKRFATCQSSLGLLSGEALSVVYYRDSRMRQWVDEIIQSKGINKVVIYSSTMAQFVRKSRHNNIFRVADFVDVDSDKWLQYAKNKSWPMSWIYQREGRKLLAFERLVANESDATFFVSKEEADLFRDLAPETSNKIDYYYNGVDFEYFNPDDSLVNPYHKDELPIVFTGAMDYFANVDAVSWFVLNVLPGILRKFPNSRFYIVGSNPGSDVKRLENNTGVTVTGRVPDIRGYLQHARVVVAPMRIARGIQNKVLEALAMSKPIVASGAAIEGIGDPGEDWLTIVESPESWVTAINRNMERSDKHFSISNGARSWVCQRFDWSINLERLGEQVFRKHQ